MMRGGALSIEKFLKLEAGSIGKDIYDAFIERLKLLRTIAVRLKGLRNEYFAHIAKTGDIAISLDSGNPFSLVCSKYLDDLTQLLNDIRTTVAFLNKLVTTDDSYRDASRRALSAILYGLPLEAERGLATVTELHI
jgi:hypothetical protein